MKVLRRLALALLGGFVLAACGSDVDAFVGTWRMNSGSQVVSPLAVADATGAIFSLSADHTHIGMWIPNDPAMPSVLTQWSSPCNNIAFHVDGLRATANASFSCSYLDGMSGNYLWKVTVTFTQSLITLDDDGATATLDGTSVSTAIGQNSSSADKTTTFYLTGTATKLAQ
jgi:hypothetical protein